MMYSCFSPVLVLAVVVDVSLSGLRVARELDRLIEQRGKPKMIVSDNVLHREAAAIWRQKFSFPQHAAGVV